MLSLRLSARFVITPASGDVASALTPLSLATAPSIVSMWFWASFVSWSPADFQNARFWAGSSCSVGLSRNCSLGSTPGGSGIFSA